MPKQQLTIRVDPGSELDHLLERADGTTLLLEKAGVRYRLIRETIAGHPAPAQAPDEQFDPRRVLDIIGVGASDEGSTIARHKDEYLADAADHHEK